MSKGAWDFGHQLETFPKAFQENNYKGSNLSCGPQDPQSPAVPTKPWLA